MIIVTGSMRSGTSTWMRALGAAGLPTLGVDFPAHWGTTALREANPEGFVESAFRAGIHFGTNPHPVTGRYVPPGLTRRHAVKVFPSGFVRTHRAFVDRVLVAIRPWREVARSRARLAVLDHRAAQERRGRAAEGPPPPPPVPPEMVWFHENLLLLYDLDMRRFPARWVSLAAARERPEEVVGSALDWLGAPDPAGGAAVFSARGRRRTGIEAEPVPSTLTREDASVFDELHDRAREGTLDDPGFRARAKETRRRLAPELARAAADRRRDRGAGMRASTPGEASTPERERRPRDGSAPGPGGNGGASG
jgi:hypothetical protein